MLPVLPGLLPRGRERADFPLVVKSRISAPGVQAFAQQTLKLRRGNCQLLCIWRSHIQHHTPLSSIVFAWWHRRKPAPRLHPFSPGSCIKNSYRSVFSFPGMHRVAAAQRNMWLKSGTNNTQETGSSKARFGGVALAQAGQGLGILSTSGSH